MKKLITIIALLAITFASAQDQWLEGWGEANKMEYNVDVWGETVSEVIFAYQGYKKTNLEKGTLFQVIDGPEMSKKWDGKSLNNNKIYLTTPIQFSISNELAAKITNQDTIDLHVKLPNGNKLTFSNGIVFDKGINDIFKDFWGDNEGDYATHQIWRKFGFGRRDLQWEIVEFAGQKLFTIYIRERYVINNHWTNMEGSSHAKLKHELIFPNGDYEILVKHDKFSYRHKVPKRPKGNLKTYRYTQADLDWAVEYGNKNK